MRTDEQLNFLDVTMNYGQGFLTFIIFGLGSDLVSPLYSIVTATRRFHDVSHPVRRVVGHLLAVPLDVEKPRACLLDRLANDGHELPLVARHVEYTVR